MTCWVKSFRGSRFLPASTRATRSPPAASSFAAQPPVAPEPTTMTSKTSLVPGTLLDIVAPPRPEWIGLRRPCGRRVLMFAPTAVLRQEPFPAGGLIFRASLDDTSFAIGRKGRAET